MTDLTPEQRETLLFPCACGHTLNDHGSLVACWKCEDDGDECSTSFEALLAARIAKMLAEARAEALRDAYAEAVQAFRNLHPVHGNTAGCYGGIGGATMTFECAIDCPNPKHDSAQREWRNIERQAFGDQRLTGCDR